MSEHNSPMYAQGAADARADDEVITRCPPGDPQGPMPPYPEYPTMYMRGYEDTYVGVPHICTAACYEGET